MQNFAANDDIGVRADRTSIAGSITDDTRRRRRRSLLRSTHLRAVLEPDGNLAIPVGSIDVNVFESTVHIDLDDVGFVRVPWPSTVPLHDVTGLPLQGRARAAAVDQLTERIMTAVTTARTKALATCAAWNLRVVTAADDFSDIDRRAFCHRIDDGLTW